MIWFLSVPDAAAATLIAKVESCAATQQPALKASYILSSYCLLDMNFREYINNRVHYYSSGVKLPCLSICPLTPSSETGAVPLWKTDVKAFLTNENY